MKEHKRRHWASSLEAVDVCLRARILTSKVTDAFICCGNDRVASRLPTGWAHFAMLVDILKGLHEPQYFTHTTAHFAIVDSDMSDSLLPVDDE